jgi:hypothetical protein
MPKIRVTRPFILSMPSPDEGRIPIEIPFTVGEHDIEQKIADHPYIKSFADGRIETPEQAKIRAAAVIKAAEDAKAEAAQVQAQADAALKRLEVNSPKAAKAANLAAESLDTPVNKLRAKQGA